MCETLQKLYVICTIVIQIEKINVKKIVGICQNRREPTHTDAACRTLLINYKYEPEHKKVTVQEEFDCNYEDRMQKDDTKKEVRWKKVR